MNRWSGCVSILVFCCLSSAGAPALSPLDPTRSQQDPGHHPDYRKCKKCAPALAKAFAYVKAHLKDPQARRVIGSMLGGYMFGGFMFMMEGNSPSELNDCVRSCEQAVKDEGFNRNWYLSMGMFFLAEYATKYGLTADVQKALTEAAKMAAEQQEETGGWCHHKHMWQKSGYNKMGGGRDLGMATAMIYGAFVEMKALGIDPGPVMERAQKNLETISDGMGIRYGTDNMVGDAAMARASYVLLGILASGRVNHPFYAKYSEGVQKRYKAIEQEVHGFAPLHYFSVGAAMHRLGPDAYRKFADDWLDKLIATQTGDGIVPLKGEDDVASTAVFACLVMMQKDGIFNSRAGRGPRPAARSNKEEFKLGHEALAQGDLAKAYRHFENVQPDRGDDDLVPQARETMKKIEEAAWRRVKEGQALEAVGEKADAIKAYQEVLKDFAGLPAAAEARQRIDALRRPPVPADRK